MARKRKAPGAREEERDRKIPKAQVSLGKPGQDLITSFAIAIAIAIAFAIAIAIAIAITIALC